MNIANTQEDKATGKIFITYGTGQQREFNNRDELVALGQNNNDQPQTPEDVALGIIVGEQLKTDPTLANLDALKGKSVSGSFTLTSTTKLP